MTIEEKINIMGETKVEISQTNSFDELTMIWQNTTNYLLKIEIEFSSSTRTFDESTGKDYQRVETYAYVCSNLHLSKCEFGSENNLLIIQGNANEDGFVGWEGESVKQYDNRGFGSVAKSFFVEVKPGEIITPTLHLSDSTNSPSNLEEKRSEYSSVREKRISLKVIGVYDFN